MQLRKTESICPFNQHNCSVGDIHTNFHYRSGYQDIILTIAKEVHDIIFFGWFQAPVQQTQLEVGEN